MPPTNDPMHRHARQASHERRKSKPKFEIPAETGSPGSPVGWVYRADEALDTVPVSTADATSVGVIPAQKEEPAKTNLLATAGIGLFLIGLGTFGLASFAALGLITAPIKMAQGMLKRN